MSRRNIFILFLLTLVCFGVGYVLTNNYNFDLCYSNLETNTFDISCHQFYEKIGDALFYGMGALTLVFLVLLAVPHAFSAWKKFAIWFIPLAVIIFITAPEPSGWVSPIPAPEQVFQWVSGLYVLVSIAIIAIASLRKPHSSQI